MGQRDRLITFEESHPTIRSLASSQQLVCGKPAMRTGWSDVGFPTVAEQIRCAWCSAKIPTRLSVGRPRRYCAQACRQRAYEKRHQQAGGIAQIDPESVAVRRSELESLQDRLYVLRSAIEVLEDVLRENGEVGELRSVAKEVVAAAGDLSRLWVTP